MVMSDKRKRTASPWGGGPHQIERCGKASLRWEWLYDLIPSP